MRELSLDFLHQPQAAEETGRCGIVAVVGRANVGKSTLLNQMVEEKVSIVSPVPQTTRNIVRAILTTEQGQLVFLDTPGIHKAKFDLNQLMNKMARSTIPGADVALLVLDGAQPPLTEDEGWMRRLCRESAKPVFAVNKSDLPSNHAGKYEALWHKIATDKESNQVPAWFKISAASGNGVEKLLEYLFNTMPESPLLFPRDILSDFPRKLAIADLVREKFFLELHDEIPHSLAVEVDTIEENANGWRIKLDLLVKRPGQKGIVIGHKGRLLRKVKRISEKELGDLYEVPVRLDMWVKIDPKWDRNHWILKRLGYKE